MRKNIDLSDEAVKALSIQAIENGTNFKNYVEAILEELAKTQLPPRAKEGRGKNKKLLP
jgi:predicted DNA binding CopG/RHH family protein